MRLVPLATRSLEQAFGLGPVLLERAAVEQMPWIAASVIEGPAVVLGALQLAGRAVALGGAVNPRKGPGMRVIRRATTGTAAYIGQRCVHFSLALPHVAALHPDATARTLLNRNVRGFLLGIGRAGAAAHYFGREWIAVRGRPAALLGYEVSPGGAVLLELIAGIEEPFALPAALMTASERELDRYRGKSPAALQEALGPGRDLGGIVSLDAFAEKVMLAVAERSPSSVMTVSAPEVHRPAPDVSGAADPLPLGFVPGPAARVPIGWIDTAVEQARPGEGRVWLGGDVLAPSFLVRALAEAGGQDDGAGGRTGAASSLLVREGEFPMDGASPDDLLAAALTARRALAAFPG
jgi:hypothetical protein